MKIGDRVCWGNDGEPAYLVNYRNGIIREIKDDSYIIQWPEQEGLHQHKKKFIFLEKVQPPPPNELELLRQKWERFFNE